MARPYCSLNIQEIERLVEENWGNRNVLTDVLHELSNHRTTRRAKDQEQKVKTRLAAMSQSTPSGQSSSPPPKQTQQQAPHRPRQSESQNKCDKDSSTDNAEPPKWTPFVPPQPGPQQPFPPITNDSIAILSAWTALEVLSPPSFVRPEDLASGDRSRVAWIDQGQLPWERGEKSRPNYRLYYQIVLGTLKLEPAVECLVQKYGDTRPERPGVRGEAALAVVVVDRYGKLVESPAVAISSFAWGVMRALNADLSELARWPSVEPELVKRVERRLIGMTSDEQDEAELRQRPLSREALLTTFFTLVTELGLPADWIEVPSFAIRSFSYFKDPNAPEPLLLNSFFLADLALACELVSQKRAPLNLQKYLGATRPQSQRDLLSDKVALDDAVSPANTPLGRWPGRGRHPLVLLQQAAVNLSFRETKNGGLVGVNGPPGTGKTTLLRDVVAGVVTDRAAAMSAFDDPETAFVNSGQRLRAGQSFIHLYQLDARLRGFEMVVASSNNKAVENVSAELPGIDAIAEDAEGLRYFKTLSDALHPADTWGAIAAVLGNAQNRSRFKQTFWWDEDVGLHSYLRAVVGMTIPIKATGADAGESERRVPRIVEAESPPKSHDEALLRWRNARTRFREAMRASRDIQVRLESLRNDLAKHKELVHSEFEARARRNDAFDSVQDHLSNVAKSHDQRSRCSASVVEVEQAVQSHERLKPGLTSRFFGTQTARDWSVKQSQINEWLQIARRDLRDAEKHARQAESGLETARHVLDRAEATWQREAQALEGCQKRLADARKGDFLKLVDDDFFAQARETLQLETPWLSDAAQRLRDEVFIAAVAVHRAFVDAAAKPLRHNLGALMNVFTTQTLLGAAKQALLSDLWSSLFLVVPLVSTTFASVNRMLGKLPLENLGWLLVDEAGQAVPQAVVGALLRTQRVVVVGDPVQIQPVVTLPDTLVQTICKRFGVDPDLYAAPSASVQTLVDAASTFATEFPTREGSRTVGIPLLVHRRCSEPMFKIANAIAYAGLMVSAKTPRPSDISAVLGPSAWFDVQGSGEDKWCAAEGDVVLRLLNQLKHAGIKPNLYIVTPFVIVADRLRRSVRETQILEGWVEEEDWRWTNERIGTVHTVQGREAEAVIFVLGAPNPSQTGARGWAGWPPNLANVAVTRAKEVIYVVGNRQLWREAGCFTELDSCLP